MSQYRKQIETIADKYGPQNSADLMHSYDILCANYGEHKAIDILHQAFEKLESYASTSYKPLLSPAGKTIFDSLENANKNTIEANPIQRLKNLVARHNAALKKCAVQIKNKDGIWTDAMTELEVEALKICLPSIEKEREKQYSAFASSGYADKLKSGLEFELR
ncbi:MAG: hypothetical protein JWR26_2037 [Pedosphaera sp.]|nr:hypothetical protein [Pedosphaera sp.]